MYISIYIYICMYIYIHIIHDFFLRLMGVWPNHQVAVGAALWLSYLYLLWPLHLWLPSLPTIPCSFLPPGFSESLIW
jgi:hypothetical protein